MNKEEKHAEVEKVLTVVERQTLLKKKRSVAEVNYRRAIKEGIELIPGAGKGLEPKPWCECHNRNPCPIDAELSK